MDDMDDMDVMDDANDDASDGPGTGRAAAVVLAGHTGDLAAATAAVTSDDPDVRVAALGALERLGALGVDRLASALDDPTSSVRRRAAELAAHHRDVDLTGALDDPDPGVVEMAAWACGEHETVSDAVLDRLGALATSSDEVLVRESAAAALGAIGDERGLPAILTACADKPTVRRRAVLALAPFLDDERVRAALAAAVDDRDWQVRQAAEDLVRAERGTTWDDTGTTRG